MLEKTMAEEFGPPAFFSKALHPAFAKTRAEKRGPEGPIDRLSEQTFWCFEGKVELQSEGYPLAGHKACAPRCTLEVTPTTRSFDDPPVSAWHAPH